MKSKINLTLSIDDIRRFWKKVIRTDGCWPWISGKFPNGYGALYVNGGGYKRNVGAHKVSFLINRGEVPDGLWVLHTCDNRECCNPEHLFLGTCEDNIADMHMKGRHAHGDTHMSRTRPETVARGDRHFTRTMPERVARGDRHGTRTKPHKISRGEKIGTSKLTESDVRSIRSIYSSGGISHRNLGKQFNINGRSVFNIIQGLTWRHVI